MNFDKESKSEEKKLGGGGGRERGGGGVFQPKQKKTQKQNNRHSLNFCAHALYKFSSSWLKWFSSFNTNKRGIGQVRGITLPMFYGIQPKAILTWILNNLQNFRILAQAISTYCVDKVVLLL